MCTPPAIAAFSMMHSAVQAGKARKQAAEGLEEGKKTADIMAINRGKKRREAATGKKKRKTGRGILNVSSPSTSTYA